MTIFVKLSLVNKKKYILIKHWVCKLAFGLLIVQNISYDIFLHGCNNN